MVEKNFLIRPLTLADKALAMAFFDQMGPATLRFFNKNDIIITNTLNEEYHHGE